MRISLTRAVAGAVIASGAVLPLALSGPASATPVTKAPTSLSMTASAAQVVPGHKDVIDGLLLSGTTPQAAKTVDLYRYDAMTKRWAMAGMSRTDTSGVAAFTIRPTKTADYRLVFHGNLALDASHSTATQIVVARLTTILTIAESAPSVTAGSPDVISGVLSTGKTTQAGRSVWLERYNSMTGKWVPAAEARTNKAGTVSFTVTPASTTGYRLAFRGTMVLAPSRSTLATVTV